MRLGEADWLSCKPCDAARTGDNEFIQKACCRKIMCDGVCEDN